MNSQYKTVLVLFDTVGKHYSYITDDANIKPNDRVVVVVDNTFKIARVIKTTGLTRGQSEKATSLIHSKLDMDIYKDRVERLATFNEIKNELRAAKEQHDEMYIYQTMARDNPRIQALLDKLAEVGNDVMLTNKSDKQ